MAYDFYSLLKNPDGSIDNMPPIKISNRTTDKYIIYNKGKMRFDNISAEIYQDETLYKLIFWGNPEYEYEFDIEDGTTIRIPFPSDEVVREVLTQIQNR